MMKIICALLIFGCAYGSTSFNSNFYVDTVIHTNLKNEGRSSNIDPARLNDFSTSDKDSVLGVKVGVKMDYEKGEMTGMFQVQRNGDCSPTYRAYGNVTLNCTLVFKDIKIKYEAKLKYGKIPTTNVKAEGKMNPSYVYVEFTTNANYNRPAVGKIYLTQTGTFQPDISGLGPLNSSLKKITKEKFVGRLVSEFFNVFNLNFSPALGRAATLTIMPPP